jgi:O-antigen ligase
VTGSVTGARTLSSRFRPTLLVRIGPVAALLAAALAQAWYRHGSIIGRDWLFPCAVLAAAVLATVLFAGVAVRPRRAAGAGLAGLVGLAAWAGLSLTWAPSPALARDEALLTLFYALTFATPLVLLRSRDEGLAALGLVAAGLALVVLAIAVEMRGGNPLRLYRGGRLAFPITYANALAALVLVGFWPAIVLASQRRLRAVLRAAALGAAVAVLAAELLIQSKGGAVGLAGSSVGFFALTRSRLRTLVPFALATAFAVAGFRPLTAPFRTSTYAEAAAAIHHAGTVVLLLTGAAVAVGALYALVDARVRIPNGAQRAIGAVVAGLVVASAAAALLGFFVGTAHPGRTLQSKWQSFKHLPQHRTTSTHLLSLGSNRYDFWRVSLDELRRHPVAGVGARGFGAVYLLHRRSDEYPRRAHSLELEVLMEDGIVGFALLLVGVGAPLVLLARRARSPVAAAALGAALYWLLHASVDWTWTFPAVGAVFFLVLGIGCSENADVDEEPPTLVPRRLALAGAVAAVVAGVVLFVPPWLSAELTTRALAHPEVAATDLRWARRLDPLATEPLVVRAGLAGGGAASVAPLEQAVKMEPRSVGLQFGLGVTYLRAGRRAQARRTLEKAHALDPRDPTAVALLRRLKSKP